MVRPSAGEQVARHLPELYALTSIECYPARALSLVRRLVGGDKGEFTEVDMRSGDFRVLVDPEPRQLGQLRAARVSFMHEHPVLGHYLAGEESGVRAISDFLTRKEFQRLGLYGEFFAHLEVEDQLSVLVSPVSTGHGAAISIDRDRRDFDDHDRLLMELLQPHLAVAHGNAIRFTRALAQRSRSDEPPDMSLLERLTDRQAEILAQLARGQTNAQIALALDISIGTVRKHLEHILRRLGVPTRTAAAVWYVTAGAVSDTSRWTASVPAMLATPAAASAS